MGSRKKSWYIIVVKEIEGPYSLDDLEIHPHIGPSTFVWRKGFLDWKRAGDVEELSSLFKKKLPPQHLHFEDKGKKICGDRDVIALENEEPPYLWWWIVVAVLVGYLIWYLWV